MVPGQTRSNFLFSLFNPGSQFHALQAGASRLPVLLSKCLVTYLTPAVALMPAENVD